MTYEQTLNPFSPTREHLTWQDETHTGSNETGCYARVAQILLRTFAMQMQSKSPSVRFANDRELKRINAGDTSCSQPNDCHEQSQRDDEETLGMFGGREP
jgi:hypothetical protein